MDSCSMHQFIKIDNRTSKPTDFSSNANSRWVYCSKTIPCSNCVTMNIWHKAQ